MAISTIELRHLLEAGFSLFDFEYEVDPLWKPELEKKIIDYFYYREIGFETPDRFKHYFRTKMQITMPYYNKLYKELIDKSYAIDEIINRNEQEIYSGSRDQDTETGSNSTGEFRSTDYPQNTGITNSNLDRASEEVNSLSSTIDDTISENFTREKTSGEVRQTITYTEIVNNFNSEVFNLESRIINELTHYFMMVFNT